MDKLSALSTDAFNFNGLITDRSPNVNHVHELILNRLENVDASLSDAAFYHFKTLLDARNNNKSPSQQQNLLSSKGRSQSGSDSPKPDGR